MREHPELIRYGLMGCFLYVRGTEVTDDITRMAVELIQRLDKRSETQIFRELLADVARVDGKMQILCRVAEAVMEQPDGIVREVIFPAVKEQTFKDLVAEFRTRGPHLRSLRQNLMARKFARHYRRMLPSLLNTLSSAATIAFSPSSRRWRPSGVRSVYTIGTSSRLFRWMGSLRRAGMRRCLRNSKARPGSTGITTNCASSRSCGAL
jgi:hypothetical protein